MERNALISTRSASLHNVRVIAGLGLFCALYVGLQSFAISLSPTLRITFSFLALASSCYFYGLVPNLILAFMCDFLGYLVHPDGVYMPFFALVVMTNAVVYSMAFYQRSKIGWGRIILAKGASTILANLLLNPLILSLMYQTPFWVLFSSRLLKNALLFPLECILLYLTLQVCIQISRRKPQAF